MSEPAVRELVSIIEERNVALQAEREYARDLYAKLDFIMRNYIEAEDGCFTFSDGDPWQCKAIVHEAQ